MIPGQLKLWTCPRRGDVYEPGPSDREASTALSRRVIVDSRPPGRGEEAHCAQRRPSPRAARPHERLILAEWHPAMNTLHVEPEQLMSVERRALAHVLLRAAWSATPAEARFLVLDPLAEANESVLGGPA